MERITMEFWYNNKFRSGKLYKETKDLIKLEIKPGVFRSFKRDKIVWVRIFTP